MNVFALLAQLILIRKELLESSRYVHINAIYWLHCLTHDMHSPMKLLRTFPALNARNIITKTVSVLQKIPSDVYAKVRRHPIEKIGV